MIKRVLIVGLGSIGRRHLSLVREILPQADIQVLRRFGKSDLPFEADGLFSSLSSAIKFAPQLSIIASPAPFHLTDAMALAKAGSHLLIEKPISIGIAGIAELITLCESNNLYLQLAYNLRYHIGLQRFRDLIFSGKLGQVHTIHCEAGQYLPYWRPEQDYRDTVSAQSRLGGGVLLELSHEIDYLRWIFGEVAWVQGTLLRLTNLEIDVEDCANLLIGFGSADCENQMVANVSLDFIRRHPTRYCLAIGSEGSARWDGISGKLTEFKSDEGEWREVFSYMPDRNETYKLQIEDMVSCVANGSKSLVSGGNELAVMNIIESIRLSASMGGKRVKVNPVKDFS